MSDLQRQSVTAADLDPNRSGAVSIVLGPAQWGAGLLTHIKGSTGLPPWGSRARDLILGESIHIENMWANAVSKAITKQLALGWKITDANDAKLRVQRSQDLLLAFGGDYHRSLSQHLRDYLLSNNGAHMEIVRASNARGSRVLGLMPLESARCFRTGDPDRPILYESRYGGYRELRADDVISITDMPSSAIDSYGIGQCAADRSWETILKLTAIETYIREKVSGSRNLAIHIISGISFVQLQDALNISRNAADTQGWVVYRGSTIIPTVSPEPPGVVTIPLAEIPDGFDAESERRDSYLRYANALGIPVQDIQPLSGQGLGTGTQTMILAEAAEGQGLAAWRKAFALAITHRVLPNTTTFAFATNDSRDQAAQATNLATFAGAMATLVEKAILNPAQALNMLVDAGYAPKEFLASDQTAGGVVEDDEKLADEALPAPVLPVAAKAATPLIVTAKPPRAKLPNLDRLIARELTEAIKLFEAATA